MSRVLEVQIESRHCTRLRGHGSRAMVVELKQRPPLWSSIAHAWTVSERTARDVIALAESRGYDVVITGPRAITTGANEPVGPRSGELGDAHPPDPEPQLW